MGLRLATIAAVGLVAVAAACADSTAPGTGMASASVTAVTPAPNAVSVSRGDTIGMTVDMPMDTASCRVRFTLHMGDSAGAVVSGHMRFGSGYRQMTFVPDSVLQPNTRYFAHMRDRVFVGDGMGGMSMQGMMGGQSQMMTFSQLPAGAMRMGSGMGWYFTTGS